MTTLTNPSDEEIDAAVAEFVAGIDRADIERGFTCAGYMGKNRETPFGCQSVPKFTRSMDAVLPLLEKWYKDIDHVPGDDWEVVVYSTEPGGGCGNMAGFGTGPSLPRAACLALLRAHGVEVVFKEK